MAQRRKTSIAFDLEIDKLVRIRGIHRGFNVTRAWEAAGLMWAGPWADQHEALDRILREGSADARGQVCSILDMLTGSL